MSGLFRMGDFRRTQDHVFTEKGPQKHCLKNHHTHTKHGKNTHPAGRVPLVPFKGRVRRTQGTRSPEALCPPQPSTGPNVVRGNT